MTVCWNNKKVGQPECGTDMAFNSGQLIAHICKACSVRAGSIVSSSTVSNVDRNKGYACIAGERMLGTIESGVPITGYMRYSDAVKIEMFNTNGVSISGAIDQEVVVPGTQT